MTTTEGSPRSYAPRATEERDGSWAVLARERPRIAADVHDLIMQDLSLALAEARALAQEPSHGFRASAIVAAGGNARPHRRASCVERAQHAKHRAYLRDVGGRHRGRTHIPR